MIIDIVERPDDRRSRSAARSGPTPALTAIPVMCVSATDDVEERIAFLEAGADDVMARPFDARELEARVEALLLRFQRSQDLAPIVSADGLTLAPRPADGRGLQPEGRRRDDDDRHQHRDRRRSRDGPTGSSWSTSPSSSAASRRTSTSTRSRRIADVVRDEAALREPELLRTYAMRHDSGLHVLAAPAAPEAAETDHRRPTSSRS